MVTVSRNYFGEGKEDSKDAEVQAQPLSTLFEFTQVAEEYSLDMVAHIDREAMWRDNRHAKIIIRPTLLLNNSMPVAVELLEEVAVKVRFSTVNNGDSEENFKDLKVCDVKSCE